jgi:hypothetical protein
MFTPRSFGKVGVEAYAAYALRAWLAREDAVSGRTRRFANWSAISSFTLGMAGQVAYHLLAQAGTARAPWPVTTIVSCLPVLVLAMGTTLAHMLRADAASAHGTRGPAAGRPSARSYEDHARPSPDQTASAGTPAETGPPARTAVTLTGSAVFAIASPSHAATVRPAHTTLATAKAAKAKGWWASGYTGKQLHGTWAGPDVGIIAWTVGLSMEHLQGQRLPLLSQQLDQREYRCFVEFRITAQWRAAGHHRFSQAFQREMAGCWTRSDNLIGGLVARPSRIRRPVPRHGVHAGQCARHSGSHPELDQQRRCSLPRPHWLWRFRNPEAVPTLLSRRRRRAGSPNGSRAAGMRSAELVDRVTAVCGR